MGALRCIRWPLSKGREPFVPNSHKTGLLRSDLPALELETAKEILSEVFGIRTSQVEEMIRLRLEERPLYDWEFNSD